MAFYKKYYMYSFLFFILTISSLIYHSTYTIYTKIFDQFSVLLIIIYVAYILYNKTNNDNYFKSSIVIISFLLCVFLYIYGYFTKYYCFCDEKSIADKYHFILHILSSIGHHIIILL